MKYTVSIIVPVYNGEQYIIGCCNMLRNQSLHGIEIVFINDGSSDNSAELIDECVQKYENVRGIHQIHLGVSAARNKGVRIASGEYIGFVDVDDNVDDDMYDTLYNLAVKRELDIVCMGKDGKPGELRIYTGNKECVEALLESKMNISVWSKLVKRNLLNNDIFPYDKRIHEDLFATYELLKHCKNMGIINIEKYHYNQREGSSSRSPVFSEKYFDAIEIADLIYKDSMELFPELCDLIEARKAKTYLRISKIYYMRNAPIEYKNKIIKMKKYLGSLEKSKWPIYFKKNDQIRLLMYLYFFPLFRVFIQIIDNK